MNRIAWIRAACGDDRYRNGQQAVEHATTVCEATNWKNAWYLDTLAAAYAESGDFAKAVEWQEKAIAIGFPGQDDHLRARLELYKSGKPYREPLPASTATDKTADSPP